MDGRFSLTSPFPVPQSQHTRIETPQRSNDEENRRIGRRVVNSSRDIGDANGWIPLRTCRPVSPKMLAISPSPFFTSLCFLNLHIDLIIPRPIMRAKLQRFRQSIHQFLIPETRDFHRSEGSIDCDDVVESPGAAFFDERLTVRRLWSEELGDVGEGGPGGVGVVDFA